MLADFSNFPNLNGSRFPGMAAWRLNSLETRPLVLQFVPSYSEKNIKPHITDPLWGESTGYRWIPHKGPVMCRSYTVSWRQHVCGNWSWLLVNYDRPQAIALCQSGRHSSSYDVLLRKMYSRPNHTLLSIRDNKKICLCFSWNVYVY